MKLFELMYVSVDWAESYLRISFHSSWQAAFDTATKLDPTRPVKGVHQYIQSAHSHFEIDEISLEVDGKPCSWSFEDNK